MESRRPIPFGAERRQTRKHGREVIVRSCVAAAVFVCAMVVATAQLPSQADADSMRAKLAFIGETGDRPRDANRQPVHTSFTDREANAFLKNDGATFLPHGLTEPQLSIGDLGRVAARGLVDLDAVRLSRPRDWFDPMNYMSGLLELTATGVVTGANGQGVVAFESATLAGVSVPKSVVQELLRFYTTTPEWPKGFDFDQPVDLPANIQSMRFEAGRATVIQ